ncbi:MAG: hypothetical protein LBT57_02765 [Puniceicoccales bacterium]|jgi:hypothetical protein|nr:hypothetical protein [Puniceicoccales bacterium]
MCNCDSWTSRSIFILELSIALISTVTSLMLLAQSRRRARQRAASSAGSPKAPSCFEKLLTLLPEKVLGYGKQVFQKLVEFLRPMLSRVTSSLLGSIRKIANSLLQATERSGRSSPKQVSPEKGK